MGENDTAIATVLSDFEQLHVMVCVATGHLAKQLRLRV
jgi:hypothetical protein